MHGVDYVVHAAALKQVDTAEYNPFEFVQTNIIGSQNVIDAAIDAGVKKVVALSTDKASSPINLYGATKLVADKLFIAGNHYAAAHPTRFSVVRYGNVMGSRGSVVPLFRDARRARARALPITDKRMTRFWITLPQAVRVRRRLVRRRCRAASCSCRASRACGSSTWSRPSRPARRRTRSASAPARSCTRR